MGLLDAGRVLSVSLTTAAARSLGEVASIGSRPPPFPIADLRLDDERRRAVAEALTLLGLALEDATGEDDLGRKVTFYRVPTRVGRAALIQLPGEVLGDPEQWQNVSLISGMLWGQVEVVYILTDGKTVDGIYRYRMWPRWQKRYFRLVEVRDGGFLAELERLAVEERAELLRVSFDLEERAPASPRLEPSDLERCAELIAGQAVSAPVAARFLRGLVDRLYVDAAAKGRVLPQLDGDVGEAARALVRWASATAYPPGHERSKTYSVLGALLEAAAESAGLEQRRELAELVERYGLIRDHDTIERLRAAGGGG
jgi:hypothetical protein